MENKWIIKAEMIPWIRGLPAGSDFCAMLVDFRKRLTEEILININELNRKDDEHPLPVAK